MEATMKQLLLALSLCNLLSATTLNELFDALKHHSQTKSDEMVIKSAQSSHNIAMAKLYPHINLFAKYDYYTDPSGIVPVAPNELLAMVKDPSVAQPFSQNITREGASFTMPLFVKTIYSMADKAQMMQKSAIEKKRINLLKNEAVIVIANANFLYLQALEKSLNTKKKSLLQTYKTIEIKVNNGRMPASALYTIDDGINQIAITQNSIALQKQNIVHTIRQLTGITLQKPIPLRATKSVSISNTLASLNPLKLKIAANKIAIDAQKEKLYPSVVAYGNYIFSQADAYNNNKRVNEAFGNIGVVVNIPLLAMDNYQNIEKEKIQMQRDEVEYEKLKDELNSKTKMLQASLVLLENSVQLLEKSIANKQKLLEIAKANFTSARLPTQEYLRYEDDVVAALAKLYKTKAQKWQTLMELAVIYANNIEEIVQ